MIRHFLIIFWISAQRFLLVESQLGLTSASTSNWDESRSSYVPYPDSALGLLAKELKVISAPLGLDVTVSLGQSPTTAYEVWSKLKGVVHRFRKQNQIIHANAHYYISTGIEYGCREIQTNTDTGLQLEGQVLPESEQCARDCTNFGRYCLTPDSTDVAGSDLVEETLFRICFANIYHRSDLRFWEYLEVYEALQCQTAPRSPGQPNECSFRALEQIAHTTRQAIESCMHLAGGTTADTVNVHLKHEVDRRTAASTNFYIQQDVPMIHFAGQIYPFSLQEQDDESPPSVFQFVCQVYHEETGILPLACDFCASCNDARKCLWLLECDGQPFDVSLLGHGNIPASSAEHLPSSGSFIDGLSPPTEESVPNATIPAATASPTTSIESAATLALLQSATSSNATGDGDMDGDTTLVDSSETVEVNDDDTDNSDSDQQVLILPIYGPVVIAGACVLIIVVIFLVLQEHRIRRQRSLAEQFKKEKQARWRTRSLYDDEPDYSPRWPTAFATNGASSITGLTTDNRGASLNLAPVASTNDPASLRPSQRLQMAADLNYSTDWLVGYVPSEDRAEESDRSSSRRSSRRDSDRRQSQTLNVEGLQNINIL